MTCPTHVRASHRVYRYKHTRTAPISRRLVVWHGSLCAHWTYRKAWISREDFFGAPLNVWYVVSCPRSPSTNARRTRDIWHEVEQFVYSPNWIHTDSSLEYPRSSLHRERSCLCAARLRLDPTLRSPSSMCFKLSRAQLSCQGEVAAVIKVNSYDDATSDGVLCASFYL